MAVDIHYIYSQIFKVWRRRRNTLFLEKISPQTFECMLDVGGYPKYWASMPPFVAHIDCLNIDKKSEFGHIGSHSIDMLIGDGCSLSFGDRSYDIVFSNSVIEHVGGMDRIKAFAREARRVGKRIWIQTPAYECPIEPHFLAPFVHWCPVSMRTFLVRWLTPWGWITKSNKEETESMVNSIRLLSKHEMSEIFPDCEIITERMLYIIPKSYIAFRK